MAFDGLRNIDDPGISHPERLALGGTIYAPLPRRKGRVSLAELLAWTLVVVAIAGWVAATP